MGENRTWWLPKTRAAMVFYAGYFISWLLIILMPLLTPFGKVHFVGPLPGYIFWGTMTQVVVFVCTVAAYVLEGRSGATSMSMVTGTQQGESTSHPSG